MFPVAFLFKVRIFVYNNGVRDHARMHNDVLLLSRNQATINNLYKK